MFPSPDGRGQGEGSKIAGGEVGEGAAAPNHIPLSRRERAG